MFLVHDPHPHARSELVGTLAFILFLLSVETLVLQHLHIQASTLGCL